jgi:hypothetical protein
MIRLLAPAAPGGVMDFSLRLQAALGTNRTELAELTGQNAAQTLAGEAVFLQYSGYGYARRGAPLWLCAALERQRPKIGTLGVYFHELYAFGPPWSSSFWLSPAQRLAARRLAQQADFWITSREAYAQWLRRPAGGKPHAVLPVFSNVGESPEFSPARAPSIAVFGSAGLRQAGYEAAGDALFAWARQASLTVHDIGPPIAEASLSARLDAAGVVRHGRLPAGEVARLLAGAAYGLLQYPAAYAAKSSVFAAYCAHGVCPVLLPAGSAPADGLSAGRHYLPRLPVAPLAEGEAEAVARAAFAWYQAHRLARHAETLDALILRAKGLPC